LKEIKVKGSLRMEASLFFAIEIYLDLTPFSPLSLKGEETYFLGEFT